MKKFSEFLVSLVSISELSFYIDLFPRNFLPYAKLPNQMNRLTVKFPELNGTYRNDPKFSDRSVWANSVDPDKTKGAVWSRSTVCHSVCISRIHLFGKATLFN